MHIKLLKMYFITAARTYEILKLRNEVIMENWSNEMWERMGNSVLNVMAIYYEWEVTDGQS